MTAHQKRTDFDMSGFAIWEERRRHDMKMQKLMNRLKGYEEKDVFIWVQATKNIKDDSIRKIRNSFLRGDCLSEKSLKKLKGFAKGLLHLSA